MFVFCALFAMLIVSLDPAVAEIRIRESRFKDGTLTVRGETEPGRTVTLDRKFKTKANKYGRFDFSVRYKPAYCVADIRSGPDIYSAFIANCYNTGSPGTGPAQPR